MRAVIKISLIFYFVFLFSGLNSAWANEVPKAIESNDNDSHNQLHNIEMLAGLPKPPFIIEKNGAGLQLDIIRAAFASVKQSVNFSHLPFGRVVSSFKRFNAEGIATLPSDYQYPGIYVSKPYITYQNVAVSLAESNFVIESVNDLKGKSIVAFQNAKKFLGASYNESLKFSSDYREFADQVQQIDLLFSRRTEVIILDINIFKFFVKSHAGGRYNQLFNVHYIFDKHEYAAGFRQEQYRDLFDLGISQIKEQGLYQVILDRYLK